MCYINFMAQLLLHICYLEMKYYFKYFSDINSAQYICVC